MRQHIQHLSVALAAALCLTGAAAAENYVNWGSEYYFTIPDDWRQIERFNVDNFLNLHGKDPASVQYDVFVCPKDADPFYSKAYVFVTSDTLANSVALMDSVFAGMKSDFDAEVRRVGGEGPISRLKSRAPTLDRQTNTLRMVSDLNAQGQDQVLTLVMKFYEKGIATFYCYTTSALYDEFEPQFRAITESFSDENLEGAAPQSAVKVVDIAEAPSEEGAVPEESNGIRAVDYLLYLAVPLFILAFVIRAVRRRRAG